MKPFNVFVDIVVLAETEQEAYEKVDDLLSTNPKIVEDYGIDSIDAIEE